MSTTQPSGTPDSRRQDGPKTSMSIGALARTSSVPTIALDANNDPNELKDKANKKQTNTQNNPRAQRSKMAVMVPHGSVPRRRSSLSTAKLTKQISTASVGSPLTSTGTREGTESPRLEVKDLTMSRRVSGSELHNRSRQSPKLSVSGTRRPMGDKTRPRSNTTLLVRYARPKSTGSEQQVTVENTGTAPTSETNFEEVPLFKQAQTARPRMMSTMLSMDALPINLKTVTEGFVKSMDILTSRHTPGHHLSAGRTSGAVVDIAWSIEEARDLGQAHMHFPHGFTVNTCRNGNVYVSGVWANWPAFIAGLRFGDQILKINDVRVQGMRPAQVYGLLAESETHTLRIKSHPYEHTVTVERNINPDTGALEILGITFLKGNIIKVLPGTSVARSGFKFEDHNIIAVNDDIVLGLPDKLIMQKFKETGSVVSVTVVDKPHFVEIIGNNPNSLDLLRRSALVDVMVGYCRLLAPGGLLYYSTTRDEDDENSESAHIQGATSLVSSLHNIASSIGTDMHKQRRQEQYQELQSKQQSSKSPQAGSPQMQHSSQNNSPKGKRHSGKGPLSTTSTSSLTAFRVASDTGTSTNTAANSSNPNKVPSLHKRVSLQNFPANIVGDYVRSKSPNANVGMSSPKSGMKVVIGTGAIGNYGAASPRGKSTYLPYKSPRRRLQRNSSSLSIQGFHEV